MSHEKPPPSLSGLRVWFGHLALVVPLLLTLAAAAPSSDFRDDIAAVRSLGLVPIGTEGWVSTVAVQLFSLLPIGGRWLRAAWVSAVALAIASRLLYSATLRVLDQSSPMPRLAPALALAAALTATLSEGWQLEGTVVGGAAVSGALIFAGLELGARFAPGDRRKSLLAGVLLGLCAAESHAAALSLGLAWLVQALVRRRVPSERQILFGVLGLASVVGLVAVATFVRSIAPHAIFDLGPGLGQSSLTTVDTSTERVTAFAAWLDNVGLISFVLAIIGATLGLLSKRLRAPMVPWLAFILADLALPVHRASLLSPEPLAAGRLAALGALALAAALGVQKVALGLERARLPFSRPAAVLLVVFNFSLVLASSESPAIASEQHEAMACETWTDEALASIAPGSLLIARSETLIFRLLAAQIVRGERRDVVVVPSPLLERGGLRRRLLALEPELAPLLREIALNGRPSEFALSDLSDVRPLYVELDPTWDPRLLDHLAPRAFWIRYFAHPLGNSDRREAFDKAQSGFDRVVQIAGDNPEHERATRAVLLALVRERAELFDRVHDLSSLGRTLERLKTLEPQDPLLRELGPKLKALLVSSQSAGPLY